MKKFINAPDTVVTDALAGVAAAHPSLAVDVENKIIRRADGPRPGKVGLVSGGGSGHGFKHGPAVGEYLAGQMCGEETAEPRFSLGSKEARQKRAVY